MRPGDIVRMKRSLLGIIDRVTLTKGAMGTLSFRLDDGYPVGILCGKELAIVVAMRQTDKYHNENKDIYDVAVLTSKGVMGWTPSEMVEPMHED